MDTAYACKNTAFAATAGAKTALVVASPAGHGLQMVRWHISMDGVTTTAVPATVDVCQLTLATAGTAGGSPPAAVLVRGRATGGSAPTVTHNYTAEPTVITVIDSFYIPQLMGVFFNPFPLGREYECDSSGGTIKALALRINVTANVNVIAGMEVEGV